MRRSVRWLVYTVTALVLLFSYRLSPGAPAGDAGTYRGRVVEITTGSVQVVVAVRAGRITSVAVPVFPDSNGTSRQVSERALPALKRQTLAVQSADVDTVSGATFTSDGYRASLQSALDVAGARRQDR
ncbi:FMN-binding protein [Jidongwangia harbinensis]|uniref:FMN-binding protein n=1 Tax=Jidongwangia harbinensis TaxID=2878561 RepID=UPI001CD9945D|nr:FMN-binding protein [Jidongwangia harbinensis]MCA2213383.1 FMN-binding protein [Jidongwangia harbinensis]